MSTYFNSPARAAAVPRTLNAPTNVTAPSLSWPSWAPTEVSPILSYIFYTTLTLFVVFIILLIIHFTVYPIFSFIPGDPGIISVPVHSDKQSDFSKSPAGNDMSGAFTKIVPCGYTLSMDLYLTGQFVEQTAPRVIVYNAQAPVKATPGKDTFITAFPSANLIVWLDPVLNDLYASVITMDHSGGTAIMETTKPITNVPLKTPFRVTYVYNQQFLEVYMNGSLETSMAFKNMPRGLSTSAPFFFGHTSSRGSCLVGNANYWGRELPSREVSANGVVQSTAAFFNI